MIMHNFTSLIHIHVNMTVNIPTIKIEKWNVIIYSLYKRDQYNNTHASHLSIFSF